MHLHRPNTFDATAAWGPYLNAANAIGTERGNVKECQLMDVCIIAKLNSKIPRSSAYDIG